MYLVKKTYDNSPEFLRNEHYENITCTVADTGVTADAEGRSPSWQAACWIRMGKRSK